jgi:hypothetical protein
MKQASMVATCLAITISVASPVRGQGPESPPTAKYPFCPTGAATLGDFVAGGTVIFDTDLLTVGGMPGGVVRDGVAVFAFDSIHVPFGSTVIGRGTRSLALLSKTTVQIDGTLIADGMSSGDFASGPFFGGPGGGDGGAGSLNPGLGPGGGLPAMLAPVGAAFSGSGGAGFGGQGGTGGLASQGGAGGLGGNVYGNLTRALAGGSGGASGSAGTGGGGGGGGLFISALGTLTVGSSGTVTADGGDGAVSGFGASGGGSGGGIVLSAAVITNEGTVRADGGHGAKAAASELVAAEGAGESRWPAPMPEPGSIRSPVASPGSEEARPFRAAHLVRMADQAFWPSIRAQFPVKLRRHRRQKECQDQPDRQDQPVHKVPWAHGARRDLRVLRESRDGSGSSLRASLRRSGPVGNSARQPYARLAKSYSAEAE